MTNTITISNVRMSVAAAKNVEETGISVADDLARVRAGEVTREALLAECLDGADDDRAEGWRDYVTAVCKAADLRLTVRGLFAFTGCSGVVTNDRGNGAGGPNYVPADTTDAEVLDTCINSVSEEADPEAWRLAREALEALDTGGPNEPKVVAVGQRAPGENGHQVIWTI